MELLAVFLALLVRGNVAFDNGLALTPPMGFNPWNCFGIDHVGGCKLPLPWLPKSGPQCHPFNESVMLQVAQAIASTPLKAAGYQFVNLDCGYSTKRRDADGNLVVNTTRFPHGMRWLGDQIHALGLKFGMYSSASRAQCCSQVDAEADDGSYGHEERDGKLFASWGIDYLKYDSCKPYHSSYVKMRDALNASGRPIVYSIHYEDYASPVAGISNSWRTTVDIWNTYESMMQIALQNNKRAAEAKHGAWNDPDMLEVGNFFTEFGDAEGRTQFSLWCLMKAPLIMGTDVTNMTAATLATLSNREAIAINQDPLGVQGVLRHEDADKQIWSGPLQDGAVVVALHNKGTDAARNITFEASFLPVGSLAQTSWSIRDIWRNRTISEQSLPVTMEVGQHDVALLVLRPTSTRQAKVLNAASVVV